jgi:predicted NBD/HSP70 family sugar kinase
MFGMDFQTSAQLAHDYFETAWPSIRVEVNRNVDYEMTAEKTYGLLTGEHKNTVLLNFDEQPCASLLIDGAVYHGDFHNQGLFASQKNTTGVHAMYKEGVCKAYAEGDMQAKKWVEQTFSPMLETLRTVLQFLDVHEVVVSGEAKYFGDSFLTWMHTCLGENCKIHFSIMGKDVKPAVSGAVWLSTYSTLQDIIMRS